ncbi:MAG: hypothetical protein KF729_14815 [Sandaracinaceae bacterium]|nr:hypothetical protein [Sandaracinaceae bacterium]
MRRLMLTLGAVVLLAACGPGEVGDRCEGGPAQNDCVDGAVCTPDRTVSVEPPEDPNDDLYFCRALCDLEANCPEGFECRQAAGTMFRSCQPAPAGM